MKTIIKIAVCVLVLSISFKPVEAQKSAKDKKEAKAALIKKLIDTKNFVFTANSMMPMRGMTRELTSTFDLRVSPDTIISYLPYFGRAYVAPIDPMQGALDFTSTQFNYTTTPRKKGGWDILIATKDQRDNKRMTLTVFDNGTASLAVTSNNDQPISFEGYVSERRSRKKK